MPETSYYQAVEAYLKYLRTERGYSPLTVSEYERDLGLFGDYLNEEVPRFQNRDLSEIEIREVRALDLTSFLADVILKDDNAPVTRNRKLYALRSFYKYLTRRDLVDQNPALNIDSTKTETQAEPIHLKPPQVRKLLQTVAETKSKTAVRDLAIIKVFIYCGLRVSELVSLDVEHIDYEDFSIKFYGKGSKERYIPLHPEVVRAIKNYMPDRNKIQPKDEDARKALFLSNHGRRISVRTVQMMVKKHARRAGLKNASEITPHKLRHTFASIFYRQTKDLKILQELLGHSDISTTQIYTHTDREQQRNAVEELPDF